jgi:hypothetical protein
VSFQRFSHGKLFHLHLKPRETEHFWLCSTCSKTYVLRVYQGNVVMLRKQAAA